MEYGQNTVGDWSGDGHCRFLLAMAAFVKCENHSASERGDLGIGHGKKAEYARDETLGMLERHGIMLRGKALVRQARWKSNLHHVRNA